MKCHNKTANKRLKPTSTALLVLCFSATLAQNNLLSSGGLAERYSEQGYGERFEIFNHHLFDTVSWRLHKFSLLQCFSIH
jgi:hypothetical protein